MTENHVADCDRHDLNPGISKPCLRSTRNFFAELATVCAHVTNSTDAEHAALLEHASKCADRLERGQCFTPDT